MAKKRSWRNLNQSERDARASKLIGRPTRLWIDPDYEFFEQWLLDSYRDRIIVPDEIGEQERPIFERATAAYFYGWAAFHQLKRQSEPENWDKIAGGDLPRRLSEIMVTNRHGREVSVLETRRRRRPANYGNRWFVRVLARHYPSLAGKNPKPPKYSKPRHQDVPSEFSALCDKWARIIDPKVKLPLLSRKQYRNLLPESR